MSPAQQKLSDGISDLMATITDYVLHGEERGLNFVTEKIANCMIASLTWIDNLIVDKTHIQ